MKFEKEVRGLFKALDVEGVEVVWVAKVKPNNYESLRKKRHRANARWINFSCVDGYYIAADKDISNRTVTLKPISITYYPSWLHKMIEEPSSIKRLDSAWEPLITVQDITFLGTSGSKLQLREDLETIGYDLGDEVTEEEEDYIRRKLYQLQQERKREREMAEEDGDEVDLLRPG